MMDSKLQKAGDLRSSGQYDAALATLAVLDDSGYGGGLESEVHRQLLLEQLLCNVLLHDFYNVKAIAALICKEISNWQDEDADLFRLLYAYARLHTAIDLTEVLDVANNMYFKYLHDTEPLEFRPVHILFLCFSGMVAQLGNRFFGKSDEKVLQKLEALRISLLANEKYNDLAMIHLTEAECLDPRELIKHLKITINSSGLTNPDLKVHLKVLQLHAYYNIDDRYAAEQLILDLRLPSLAMQNQERCLWAQYLQTRFTQENSEVDNVLTRGFGNHFANLQESAKMRQGKGFLKARTDLRRGSVNEYSEGMLALLQQSHSNILPKRAADLVEKAAQTDDRPKPSQSAWLFWYQYMNMLPADMKALNRRPLAIRCVETFFQVMIECTIPELQYTLTTVSAECFEDIGDKSQVLHWRGLGAKFAQICDDQDIKDEAECNLQLALADKAIITLDDPHGIERKRWNKAKLEDLTHLQEDAKERGSWECALRYARFLLHEELGVEISQGLAPTGQKWYAITMDCLNHLEHSQRLLYHPMILFSLAHAMFDYKDYAGSIKHLEEVINAAKEAEQSHVEKKALFTWARASLHLYQSNHKPSDWSASNERLNMCLDLCIREEEPDWMACCHILKAALWYSKQDECKDALRNSLYHLGQVRDLWAEGINHLFSNLKLDDLLTRYKVSGRNAKTPYPIFGMAVDICTILQEPREAWSWIESSKARALDGSFAAIIDNPYTSIDANDMDDNHSFECSLTDEIIIQAHWMIIGERVLLYVCQNSTTCTYMSWELSCTKSTLEEWYYHSVTSKEDLSDPETAEEILSELQELVKPLVELAKNNRNECLFILCPTQILFKLPLHAIPVDGTCLLDLVPVVYTYSYTILRRILQQQNSLDVATRSDDAGWECEFEFFASPTGDTPAGSEIVSEIAAQYGGRQYIDDVSKETFLQSLCRSSWVHFHGHVVSGEHPLNQALLFHHGEKMIAREAFRLDLSNNRPVVLLIGCGSGVERLDPGDEPLGLVSGLLFAGASSVIGTMWPIHDRLSGAKFSQYFYGIDSDQNNKLERSTNLAKRIRAAALSIKNNELTRAPYFWAGFVLYGRWTSHVIPIDSHTDRLIPVARLHAGADADS